MLIAEYVNLKGLSKYQAELGKQLAMYVLYFELKCSKLMFCKLQVGWNIAKYTHKLLRYNLVTNNMASILYLGTKQLHSYIAQSNHQKFIYHVWI